MATTANQYPWLQGSGYYDTAMSAYNGASVPNNLNFLGNDFSYLSQIPQSNMSASIQPFQQLSLGDSIGQSMQGMDWLNGSTGNTGSNFNSQYGSTIGAGIQGLSGLWGAWNGMQQNKLAQQQMNASLALSRKNYANNVQTYNTQLEDRTRARAAATGASQESVTNYMNQNRLK